MRQAAEPELSFDRLQENPQAYQDKTVILGGVIVALEHVSEGTLLEVYQTKLDRVGEPVDLDISAGRFLALYDGFLDEEIYSKGRKVTIAGEVQGQRVRDLGQLSYRYPFLTVREIHLWKQESDYRYLYPYPYPYPYGGYGHPFRTPYPSPYLPYGPYWY
jgi:outer membrane lipoprotein